MPSRGWGRVVQGRGILSRVGGVLFRGCAIQEVCCPGVCAIQGVCCPGGVLSRGCVVQGVFYPGGGLSRGFAVHDRTGSDIITPPSPCEQNESQMLVKILPCPKLRLRTVFLKISYSDIWWEEWVCLRGAGYFLEKLKTLEIV